MRGLKFKVCFSVMLFRNPKDNIVSYVGYHFLQEVNLTQKL